MSKGYKHTESCIRLDRQQGTYMSHFFKKAPGERGGQIYCRCPCHKETNLNKQGRPVRD